MAAYTITISNGLTVLPNNGILNNWGVYNWGAFNWGTDEGQILLPTKNLSNSAPVSQNTTYKDAYKFLAESQAVTATLMKQADKFITDSVDMSAADSVQRNTIKRVFEALTPDGQATGEYLQDPVWFHEFAYESINADVRFDKSGWTAV